MAGSIIIRQVIALHTAGRRNEVLDLFDAHLPLIRYEQQLGLGLAVRKHVLTRGGVITSDAQRKPDSSLTGTARAEIDYLLARLAKKDKRAAF